MSIKDSDLWKEYSKNIEKIKNPNKISFNDYTELPVERIVKKIDKNWTLPVVSKNAVVSLMNRKEKRKFRSEYTIDLHGHTRHIESVMENFCLKCINENIKNITVITGKGEGIVKSSAMNWLNNSVQYVVCFSEIKDSKGESGAFAVKLRSK